MNTGYTERKQTYQNHGTFMEFIQIEGVDAFISSQQNVLIWKERWSTLISCLQWL